MVMHYPSPAEVRRGGWLTRAEGRIKTKGVPVGPRPASLKRILEGADGESSLFSEVDSLDDAPDVTAGVRREVGSGRRNDARDVIAVKRALHDAGHYTMPCPAAPSPFFDSDLSLAIHTFQGRHGLKEDGVIRPGDLLVKGIVDAAQIARCRQLASQVRGIRADLRRANQDVVEAQDQLENVERTIEGLEGELRLFAGAQVVQEILDAIAQRLWGAIAVIISRLSFLPNPNKQAMKRIASGLSSLKLEKEHWLGKLAEANAFLNETLRELDGLRAQQRRHGCIG